MISDADVAASSEALLSGNPFPMWLYDAETFRFLNVNEAVTTNLGYAREQLLAMTLTEVRLADDRGRREPAGNEARFVRSDGTIVEAEVANSHGLLYAGRPAVLAILFDVSERNAEINGLRAHRAIVNEAEKIAELGGFILDLREGRFRLGGTLVRAYCRSAMPVEEAAAEVARVWYPEDAREGARLLESIRRCEPYEGEFRMIIDDAVRWFHSRTTVVRQASGAPTSIIGIAVDITERKRQAERLRCVAFSDAATGLPNRAALFEDDAGSATTGSVVLIRVGWVAGASRRSGELRDRAAHAVASALGKLAPADARVFRYSDRVFGILTKRSERLRVPLPLTRRIVSAFERPVPVDGDEIVITPRIGVAVNDYTPCDMRELVRRAEAALHESERGEDQIVVYSEELAQAHHRHASIECNLRHAIVDERIGVVYQPIVSLHSGRIVGAEALMRWDCPGIGPVPPSEFIAIAEEGGVILRLGEWILREACLQARNWQLAGLGRLRIAINVSARQVQQREFFRMVMSACDGAGLAPSDLELEITERVMLRRDGLAIRNLEALRRAGVRVSIDDFGTGYSALSYLGSLPLDVIKIDRAFIAPIVDDAFQADIAASVIAVAHRRGLTVVGEGVETEAQLERLAAMGCDEAQGFLFSEPVDGERFADLVRPGWRDTLERAKPTLAASPD